MKPETLIAGRFETQRLAGSGGMGDVWLAFDRVRRAPAAVKLLRLQRPGDLRRFEREAQLLSELQHANIVEYLAHGTEPDGTTYLAMEWLEGETLAARLRHGPLAMRDAMRLAAQIASALATAHAAGFIHRDVKPANIVLVDGDVARPKLLDFGLARVGLPSHAVTLSGTVIGTPAYMAPEQARGERKVDARVDVFALGCVLFECLAGRAAFEGEHVIAVLAKVVLEETPRLADVCPDVPRAISQLVGRMMSKSASDRPPDGAAVIRAIEHATSAEPTPGRATIAPAAVSGITTHEQRLLSVILVNAERREDTMYDAIESAATLVDDVETPLEITARSVAHEHGATPERLADGSLIITLSGVGVATDQAARAARSALAIRAAAPDATIVLATGRGDVSWRWPVGEVIDRAVQLLLRERPRLGDIPLDEVTAGLLGERFDLGGDERGLVLRGVRTHVDSVRTVLGKAAPHVGRDRDLATLTSLVDACIADASSSAAVIIGAAGSGKSRLLHELMVHVRARYPEAEVLVGRGDPMRVGSSFGSLAPAIRDAAGVRSGEPPAVARRKLAARVARHVAPSEAQRVTEFLGEMVGVSFSSDDSVALRAARLDATVMGDQMRRAFEDWLDAECRVRPVVIALEDLHWGDRASIQYVEAALRTLRDRPFAALAFARPELDTLFPNLWSGRGLTRLELAELSQRASEKLVRAVLGNAIDPPLLSRIVTLAAGNPLYLEELVRAVAEGRTDALPPTLLAMVQSRLDALAPDERRLLRAASVFGDAFWVGAAHALLGNANDVVHLPAIIERLCEREWIVRRSHTRFDGESEFAFRHALVREAAYATLTDADRALGHRLAAEWLVARGEREAVVVAEHFDRGGEPARAIEPYGRAAEQALDGNDTASAIQRVERAIECGATGIVRGRLRVIAARARRQRGEYSALREVADDALQWLPVASEDWYAALNESIAACTRLGLFDDAERLARDVDARVAAGGRSRGLSMCATRAVAYLFTSGRHVLAHTLVERLVRTHPENEMEDPAVWASMQRALASRALHAGDMGEYLERQLAAIEAFERGGDRRAAALALVDAGFAQMELGLHDDAVITLRAALGLGERMALEIVMLAARNNLGLALARLGRIDEAMAFERLAIETSVRHGDHRAEGSSHCYLALMLLAAGDLEAAEREARLGVERLAGATTLRPQSLAVLADVLLARGRFDEALGHARQAIAPLDELGSLEEGEALIGAVYAAVLHATGAVEAARVAIGSAATRLLARAARIGHPEWRQSFLQSATDNARVLALARAWGVDTNVAARQ